MGKGIVLPRKIFDQMISMARRWLDELQNATIGQQLLLDAYRQGEYRKFVYCLSTGQHWSLKRYATSLLLPITLKSYMTSVESPTDDIADAVYSLTSQQIATRQKRFGHFDYTASPDWLRQLIHTDASLKNCLSTLIDNLDCDEMTDLLYLNSVIFYTPTPNAGPLSSLKLVSRVCRMRLQPANSPQKWDYIEPSSGEHFVEDGSLGWLLCGGSVQALNRHFPSFDFEYPDHVLKGYHSPEYRITRSSVVEICVFSCHWCTLVVRYRSRVIATSPLLNLSSTLQRLSGEAIILDTPSLKCCCGWCQNIRRQISDNHDSLQCLAARSYKRLHHRAKPVEVSVLPQVIRDGFFSRCSENLRHSRRAQCQSQQSSN